MLFGQFIYATEQTLYNPVALDAVLSAARASGVKAAHKVSVLSSAHPLPVAQISDRCIS